MVAEQPRFKPVIVLCMKHNEQESNKFRHHSTDSLSRALVKAFVEWRKERLR